MSPDKRRHSPYTGTHNTILIEFDAEMVPHDSPEFQERARLAALRPVPDYLTGESKPDDQPPPPAG